MDSVRTEVLEIFYEHLGLEEGRPLLILHGWPDAPRGWNVVAQYLIRRGWRAIIPYLRGSGPTRFLSEKTPRDGSAVALAQDAIDFADALGLDRFFIIGHDWGARAAYTIAALYPQRLFVMAALSLAYQSAGVFKIPDFEQSRRFWYQWFQCIDEGAEAVRRDPVGFARIQWDTWSPPGWFDEAEFARTSQGFNNPDWAAITLNAYRARWIHGEETDPRYYSLEKKVREAKTIAVPTLMIQGGSDYCDDPKESERQDSFFTGGYRRLVFDGIGHFPHREASAETAKAIADFFRQDFYFAT